MRVNNGPTHPSTAKLLKLGASCFFMFMLVAVTNVNASAQADFEKGYQAYQTYHETDFDSINLANGNLVLNIPLLTYQQRGGLPPVVIAIRSNSTTFQSQPPYSSGPLDTKQHEVSSGVIGSPWGQPHVMISPGGLTWREERITLEKAQLSRFVAIDDSGASHSLGQDIYNSQAPYVGNIKYSVDGSDLMLTAAANPLIIDRKGNVGGLVDPNGNAISLYGRCAQPAGSGQFYNPSLGAWEGYAYGTASANYIVDSLGRTIPNPSYIAPEAEYSCVVDNDSSYYPSTTRNSKAFDPEWPTPDPNDAQCPASSSPKVVSGTVVSETYLFPAENNGSISIKFCYQQITVSTSIPTVQRNSSDQPEPTTINETWSVLTAAILPNGTSWKFGYDLYGQVSTVTMPTGAVVTYTYGGPIDGMRLACGNPPGEIPVSGTPTWPFTNLMSSRMITGKQVTVANPSGTLASQKCNGSCTINWSYSSNIGSGWPGTGAGFGANKGTVTVTDPGGNTTAHTFSLLSGGSYGQPVCGPYETVTTYNQGASSTVKTVATTYSYTGVDHANPTNFSNYIAIGVVPSTVTTTLNSGSGSQVRKDTYTYDTFGTYQDYKGASYPFSFGQKLSEAESDFGSGTAGATLRTTLYMNLWQSSSKYYKANMIDLPCYAVVFSGSTSRPSTCASLPAVTPITFTQYAYDEPTYDPQNALGALTTTTRWITSSSNAASHTSYNAQGMPTSKLDPLGNKTSLAYDATGLFLKQITYPAASPNSATTEGFTYDANTGLLLNHTDQNNQATSYSYDAMRRLTGVIYPTGGGSENYSYYDVTPPYYQFTKTLDSSRTYSETGLADELGRKVQTQITSDSYGTMYADTAYDLLGRIMLQTNPYRTLTESTYGLTLFTYDAVNRKSIQIQPDGSSQQWCYMGLATVGQTNCHGQLSSLSSGSWVDFQDEAGHDWQRISDGLGHLAAVMEPNGTSSTPSMQTTYLNDVVGNLLSVAQHGNGTDTPRNSRSFTYDGLSRLMTSTNPESGVASYTYDADNNLLTKVSPAVNSKTGTQTLGYCYDPLNHLVGKWSAIAPTGCSATPTSVTNSLLATYTFGPGTGTPCGTNTVSRLIDEKEYLNSVLVSESMPCAYDAMGRIETENATPYSPSSSQYVFTTAYNYDGTTQSEGNSTGGGVTLTYQYDKVGRLSTVLSSLTSSGSNTYPGILYSATNYGPAGITRAYYAGNTGFELQRNYDDRQRVLDSEVYPSSDVFATGTVTISGQLVGGDDASHISVTVGGLTETIQYGGLTGYDSAQSIAEGLAGAFNQNEDSTVSAAVGGTANAAVITFTALVVGQVGDVSLSYSPSSTPSFTMADSGSALTGGSAPAGSAYVYSLAYDPAGNVAISSDSYNGSWSYSYDTLERLTSVNNTASGGPSGYTTTAGVVAHQCWAYDSFGNRTFELDSPNACPATLSNSTPPTHYEVYNASNQITSSDTLVSGLVYDSAGNVTQDAINKYVYDIDGRLCAVENILAQTMTQYVYDAEGRRVARGTLTAWPAAGSPCAAPTTANTFTLTATYLHEGSQDIEIDSSGVAHQNVYADGQILATYAEIIGSAPTLYFDFNDWLGTKRVVASTTGAVQNYWGSDPFGDYLTPHVATPDPSEQHFTGKQRDAESGNDYFGARYFASAVGRFMSPDQPFVDQHPVSPQSWNLYSYARNNPLIMIDPNGLDCVYASASGSTGSTSVDHSSSSEECGSTEGTWVPGTVSDGHAAYNPGNGQFQVASYDGGKVDFATFAEGAQTDAAGKCLSGCQGYGFGSTNAAWLAGMTVGGGSLGDMMSFMVNRTEPIHGMLGKSDPGILMKILSGPLDFWHDHWAGPGGMGAPHGRGDWAAMVHDYNFDRNDIKIGMYFDPSISQAQATALIRSNNNLIRNAGGVQGVKMGLFFGAVNAFQQAAHSF